MKKFIKSTCQCILNAVLFVLELPINILFLLQNPQYILVLILALIAVINWIASSVCEAISNTTLNLFNKTSMPDKASHFNTRRTCLNPSASDKLSNQESEETSQINTEKAGDNDQTIRNTVEEIRTVTPA